MSLLLHDAFAVEILGNGQVSQALQRRLAAHGVPVRAVHDSRGIVSLDASAPPAEVLIDCTPPLYGAAGAAWIERLAGHVDAGGVVVTANKAPVVDGWPRLQGHILHSATVGGGTPVVPFVERLAARGITRIEARLSGSLDFVYARLAAGDDLADAIAAAQAAGFAEPDPSLDLDGTDALAKAAILHRIAFGEAPGLADLPRLTIDAGSVCASCRPVLVIGAGRIEWDVRDVDCGAPGEAAVTVWCGAERFSITGPGAGPDTTADNLLEDILALRGA